MGEFFTGYGLFLAKLLTFFILFLLVIFILSMIAGKGRREKGAITVTHINELLDNNKEAMYAVVLDADDLKNSFKNKKKQKKIESKEKKKASKIAAKSRGDGETIVDEKKRRRMFVLDFKGDIKASQVSSLRRELTTVLSIADVFDEVLVNIESGGGTVHGYGLAAAQLERVRNKNIALTVCVDKVAASGGYLMACVANKIIAAPFAIIGSIGVMAQIPNVHRLLEKHDVDIELLTAGEYKRTLTVMGENTDKGREKFLADIQIIHDQFKNFIARFRPQTDIESVATGETWSGHSAIKMHLVDEIMTSDEYIVNSCETTDVYRVKFESKKSLPEKFGFAAEASLERFVDRWLQRANAGRYLD